MNASPLLLTAAALSLAACGPRITDNNLREVRDDMTTKEIESILGPPTKIETPAELKSTEVKTLHVTRYIYDQDGKSVVLTFVGDRLAIQGVAGQFEK